MKKAALAVALAGLTAVPFAAQQSPDEAQAAQLRARQQIAALESVFESAVKYGAEMLGRHVQTTATSQSVLLTGLTRARGFRLDGYGVLFDVEFPSIRRSVVWTMRALERPDPELLDAMKELRKNTRAAADPRSREELDRAIKTLEEQARRYDRRMQPVSAPDGSPAAAPQPPADDPRAIYAAEIAGALIGAILDHGASVDVPADEWLTVAARESLDLRFLSDAADDTATTLILRIKGSDLVALGESRISREDARARLEVKQY